MCQSTLTQVLQRQCNSLVGQTNDFRNIYLQQFIWSDRIDYKRRGRFKLYGIITKRKVRKDKHLISDLIKQKIEMCLA